MTDHCVSQARARLSRATVPVFAALVVLSTHGVKVDARHVTSFVATDLGTLGGSFSEAFAVSDKGLVVGRSATSGDAEVHPFLWSEGTMIDLGTLAAGSSSATVISNNGVIAGFGPSENGTTHAFVRTDGNGLVDLGTLGGSTSSPTAINAKGDIVGVSDVDDGFHAFLWTKRDGMIDLGTLDGRTSNANAISDSGLVVGDSLTTGNVASHAFMWTRHSGMADLGTLGGATSSAQAVSDDGVIVGFSQTDKKGSNGQPITHAFVRTHGSGMVDIGATGGEKIDGLDSFAEKIAGRFVIGHLTIPTSPNTNTTHGFVWTQKQGLVDIGTLDGDVGSFVVGVNDRGLVAGNSFTAGASRAFVWSRSSGFVQLPLPLEEPAGSSSQANAMKGDFIVGSSPSCAFSLNCHATLWKPASHSRKDRNGDDD
jgi:probable HAF family extracellular repeat protein